jgi:hypothetical protein
LSGFLAAAFYLRLQLNCGIYLDHLLGRNKSLIHAARSPPLDVFKLNLLVRFEWGMLTAWWLVRRILIQHVG